MKKTGFLKFNKKGFTFVECIVAVALFAIIGTLGFSMFSNSARYMSKAKKEEAKQSQAQKAAQIDDYKTIDVDSVEKYIVYSAQTLTVQYTVLNNKTVANYYASLTYSTDYGDVNIMTPIKPAPDIEGKQPLKNTINATSITRYMVLSDGYSQSGTSTIIKGRYIYIYDNPVQTTNGILSVEDEYVD